jgi:hypothetical protein
MYGVRLRLWLWLQTLHLLLLWFGRRLPMLLLVLLQLLLLLLLWAGQVLKHSCDLLQSQAHALSALTLVPAQQNSKTYSGEAKRCHTAMACQTCTQNYAWASC